MDSPSVFISYSWQTKELADKIANDLQLVGIVVIKDNQELKYTDSISSFMKRIRESDYSLLLISDGYLKSKNCLFEVLEFQKDENHWGKVLPVVCEGTKIYSALERLEYVNFWSSKSQELETALKLIDPVNAPESLAELKLFRAISGEIDGFLQKVTDSLHHSPQELLESSYSQIIEKLGVEFNPKAILELLSIVNIENLEHREIALDEYLKNNPESGHYYSIKAGTAKEAGKFDQAIHYYKKGLELDPTHYELLNNLGQILEHKKDDFEAAKNLYERAIKSIPDTDVARLNLGVLLRRCYDDEEGARRQYEAILDFEPNNAKAHNNLSNYYKRQDASEEELDKAEYHLKKAIESDPNYIDALFNYGNFLKVYRKKIEEGNDLYRRILELDKEGNLKEVIEMLIKSNKG